MNKECVEMFVSITREQLKMNGKILLAAMGILIIGFAGYYAASTPKGVLWSQNKLFALMAGMVVAGYLFGLFQGKAESKKKKMIWFAGFLAGSFILRLFSLAMDVHMISFILAVTAALGLYFAIALSPFVIQYVKMKSGQKAAE
jgi:hypothetical protein